MARVTERREALGDIAALVSSGKPSSEILERVLEVARRAVGAKCLSLVAADGEGGRVRSWTAQVDGSADLAARCVEAGAASLASDSVGSQDGVFVAPIAYGDGLRAALIGDVTADRGLLDVICGYLSLILANERLSASVAAAREQADKRVAEVAAVYEIGQAIGELDIERLLPLITEKAAAVMDAQACSLVLRDFEANQLTIEASWGLAHDIVQGTRISPGEGIAGTVAETGEAMLLVDVEADPRFAAGSVRPREGIVSSICAPLKDEMGRVMGVLNIRRHSPAAPFTDADLRLFCVFGSQAALAISNAKLYASLSQRIAEMTTISDLLRAINSTLHLDYVLNQIADNIVHVVGFDRCCVYLSDARTKEFVAGIQRGYAPGELPERVEPGQGVVGLAGKEGIPIFERDSSGVGQSPQTREGTAFLATPIVVRDQCIGVVVADNLVTGRPVQPPEVELLSTFVSQAGIAIENARLYEAMEEKYSELNVLFEHSKTISSAYGLENIAQISTDVVRKAVPCDGCALLLLGEKRATVALQAAAGIPPDVSLSLQELLAGEASVAFVRGLHSPAVVTRETAVEFSQSAQDVLKDLIGPRGSALLVPLLAEDAAVGAFVLLRRGRPEFATGELKLLSIVASQAAVVLKNALRYEQRMRRQVLDLSALYEFSRRISSSSSLEEALDVILAIVSELVDCDESVIYAIDHERGVMVPTAARSSSGSAGKLPEQPLTGNSVMSWTVRERKAVVSPDIGCDPRFDPGSLEGRPLRSLMSIPLMVQDEAVGLLCVYGASPNLYSEDDVRVLSIIASQSAAIYKELEALAALTSYTENILSSIAAGVVTLDSDGVVLTWNRAAESIVRLPAAEVVGMNYRDVASRIKITDADKAATIQIVEKVRSTGRVYQGYKLCYHPLDEDPMYLNISASVLSNNSGEPLGLVIIFEDITRQIKMEDEFRRMGELAAVGQLAASIAHELRNPLSSIKGAAQFLRKEYEDHAAIVEFLNIIIEEVNGLSKLTTEFLEYARPMELELGPVDVNEVVRKTLQLMSVHIGESGVVVIDQLGEDLPAIYADEKQLEQVLRNVVLNGLQSMPDGGTLSILTLAGAGRVVELAISDTGSGIPQEKLDRIFAPFFTTKTKGTGLGLSVVQKIVENHGGHIEVSSTVGQGTTFTIVLPVAGAVRTSRAEADTTERRDS
jgi:PAS domain S-box-containing protein